MIQIGKKIKQYLYEQRIPVKEFAEKINRSRTVVYHFFGRKSIDTELLTKISEALKHDFFFYYSEPFFQSNFILKESKGAYVTKIKQMEEMNQELSTYRKENSDLKEKVELLKKLNSYLEKGKK